MKRRSKHSARGAAPAPAAPPPTAASSTSSRAKPPPELIAALEQNLDDRDACSVYADWLLEHGDPLGEIMAAELRSSDPYSVAKFTYLQDHFPFAILNLEAGVRVVWKNGLFESLVLDTHLGIDAIEQLAATPAARFLRELRLSVSMKIRGYLGNSGPPDERERDLHERSDFPTDPIPALVKYPLPRTLRKLDLSLSLTQENGENLPIDLDPLYPQLSHLEALTFSPPKGTIGTIDLPALQSLTTSFYDERNLAELARAKLPKLTALTFQYANWSQLPAFSFDGAPALSSLTLVSRNAPKRDGDYAAIVAAPIFRRIRALGFGDLERGDVERIAAIAPALTHLDKVEIRTYDDALRKQARTALAPILGARLMLE